MLSIRCCSREFWPPGSRLAISEPASPSARLAALDALLAAPAADAIWAQALEAVVRALADNRRALLPHRGSAPVITATVKDPCRGEPPALDVTAVLETLPPDETISVRLGPELTPWCHADGPLGRPTLDDGHAIARGGLSFTVVRGRPELEVGWVVAGSHQGRGIATAIGRPGSTSRPPAASAAWSPSRAPTTPCRSA